jgi:1-acyl-sn-glycerol-3-phosphate acyltransferase
MTRDATKEVQSGRQLIIFPEGTRRPVDAPPDYKSGIAQIYGKCGVPCVPVALNSGLFWPRRMFLRYPGPLIVEFLPAIAPGVPRREFMAQIADAIETSTDRIVAEARAEQAKLFGRVPSAPASDSQD